MNSREPHRTHRLTARTSVWMSVVGLFVFSLAGNCTPVVESSGAITVDWDTGAISLDSTLTTGWASDTMQADMSIHATETGIDRFTTSVSVCFRESLTLSASTAFDPHSATFTQAAFEAQLPLLAANLSLSGLLKPGAFGSKVTLSATGDRVVQSLAIFFNLDKYGSIQTTSCALPFTYAEARFAIPLDCCESSVTADISWDAAGFSELNVSAPDVGGLPFGVSFGAFLTFTADEKTLELAPSLNMENPDCFDFYTGLVWDANTNTLSEIRFYGMGVRCEIGDIRFRMLYCFDPSTLALVKSPYKSLLGLVWPIAGCCGHPGEGSIAFFFGENNLFDLEEVVGELIMPVTETFTLKLNVEYPMSGLPTFTFGWTLS